LGAGFAATGAWERTGPIQTREEPVYIGVGTLILIIVLVLLLT
jgi:hypothetical protein